MNPVRHRGAVRHSPDHQGAVPLPATHNPKHLNRLERFLRTAAEAIHTCDQDPAQEQDDDGHLLDTEGYGWAAHRRDRSLWYAYLPVRSHADALLTTATAQLDMLPQESRPAWASKIAALARAADTLEAGHDRLMRELREHLTGAANPNLASVDLSVTEFFDEAWPALDVWAGGGSAVTELNTTVHGTAPPPAPNPALRLVSGGVTGWSRC
ncbi:MULTISPECIES: hypothetical protein [Streptomyces]|uniref:hypothetical protein n=1 Tax=Streptomyces TaxID=1883 RepID=UPI00025CE2AC|nr:MULTISPECIES: hypothetical protein [Streptomyces]EIF93131.1 hypothetical protein [Streptomyces tsukubensis NRRL18488]MYS66528.1 hypothetical protein [Streptomyces sp. SID5473]